MSTNQHNTFIELYRMYKEMVDQKDFIQSLERLRSGTPSESKDSLSSAVAAGINRPLARLAHNSDAILETLQTTRAAQLLSNNVVLEWDGSTLVISAGTINLELPVTGFTGNGSSPGKIVYSTNSGTPSSVSIAAGSILYINVDKTITGATDLISNLATATSDSLFQTLQGTANRLKVIPIAYNASGCLNFFCNNISLPAGSDYTFDTGINSFYTRSSVFNNNRNALILFAGDTQVYASWTASGNQLTFPQFSIVTPGSGSPIVISGTTISSFITGKSIVVNLDTASMSSTSTFDFDGVNNNMLIVARRIGNRVILFNGIQFPTGSDLAYIPFNHQLSHVLGVNIREGDYELALESNSSLSANRSLTFDVNNVNRTIDLSSNLTIGSGGLTTGSGAVAFGSNTLAIGSSGTTTLGSGNLTIGTGNVAFAGGAYSFGAGDITTAAGNITTAAGNITTDAGDITFSNSGPISLNQSVATSSNVTFNQITANGTLTAASTFKADGIYGNTNSTQALFINENGSGSLEAGSVRVNNNLYVDTGIHAPLASITGNLFVKYDSSNHLQSSVSSAGVAELQVSSAADAGYLQIKSNSVRLVPETTNGDTAIYADGHPFLRLPDNWAADSGIEWVNEHSSATSDYSLNNQSVSLFKGRAAFSGSMFINNPADSPTSPGQWMNNGDSSLSMDAVSSGTFSTGIGTTSFFETSVQGTTSTDYVSLVSASIFKAGTDVIFQVALANVGGTSNSFPLEIGIIDSSASLGSDSSFVAKLTLGSGGGVLLTSASTSTLSSYQKQANILNISHDYRLVIRQKRTTSGSGFYVYRICGIRVYPFYAEQRPGIHLYAPQNGLSTGGWNLVSFYNARQQQQGQISFGSDGSTITYGAFTGCHNASVHVDEDVNLISGCLVSVVSASNENENGVVQEEPTYEVKITTSAQDPACMGVYVDEKIKCVGNGTLNVCSQGGDISRGDYICSASDVPGTGMKQDDTSYKNYTVAKAMSPATWTDGDTSVKRINVIYLGG